MNLDMLAGGMLVALGVLAGGVADRIRGVRAIQRERKLAEPRAAKVATARDQSSRRHSATLRASRSRDLPAPQTSASDAMQADVVATLTAAGYRAADARSAAEECPGAVRHSFEAWTRAALKIAMKGKAA